jgi:hypothetical protein
VGEEPKRVKKQWMVETGHGTSFLHDNSCSQATKSEFCATFWSTWSAEAHAIMKVLDGRELVRVIPTEFWNRFKHFWTSLYVPIVLSPIDTAKPTIVH